MLIKIFVSIFKNSNLMSVYDPYETYYAGILICSIHLERYPFDISPMQSIDTNFRLDKDYECKINIFIYKT